MWRCNPAETFRLIISPSGPEVPDPPPPPRVTRAQKLFVSAAVSVQQQQAVESHQQAGGWSARIPSSLSSLRGHGKHQWSLQINWVPFNPEQTALSLTWRSSSGKKAKIWRWSFSNNNKRFKPNQIIEETQLYRPHTRNLEKYKGAV